MPEPPSTQARGQAPRVPTDEQRITALGGRLTDAPSGISRVLDSGQQVKSVSRPTPSSAVRRRREGWVGR